MEIAGQDAELPEIRSRSRVLSWVVVLGLMGLATRLFLVQIIDGDTHYQATNNNVIRVKTLPAVRGEIRDRKGRVLATTRPSYNVRVTPALINEEIYHRLLTLLGADRESAPPWETLAQAAKKDRNKEITILEDVARDKAAILETNMDIQGVRIDPEARRHYPTDTLFAHLVGYVNEISADELRTRRAEGYRPTDLIGRAGVERQWEPYLRGTKGFETTVVDRKGVSKATIKVSDLVEGPTHQAPVPGNSVSLTLDMDIQRIADRALRNKEAAAAVVLDVTTGRVLAAVSTPGFSPNMMGGHLTPEEESRLRTDRRRPYIDKTSAELYNPGSTFKAISAIAGLEERIISPDDRLRCNGFLQVGRRRFKCTKVHGVINLHTAIVQSCNVYFYDLGSRPGMMDRIAKVAANLGLGAQTGFGSPGEAAGFIPTEAWHRELQVKNPKYEGFVIGHALNTAIGEGATRVTVMQLAMLYGALASGGKLWLPQMVEKVESPDGHIVEEFPPRVRREITISPETLAFLRNALIGVVNDPKGTAFKARSKRIVMAGKTGTAQVQTAATRPGGDPPPAHERLEHAWFAGFAPADKPKIAFAVLVEHGGHGGDVAAPVATEIVDGYFDLMNNAETLRATAAPRLPH